MSGQMVETPQDRDKREIERLRSFNSTYEQMRAKWDFFLAAYTGGQDFLSEMNLFKHRREHPADFQERLKRLNYRNYCRPLVEFYTDFIYAETITREGGSQQSFYTDFLKDVNRKGEDITTYMKDVSDEMQVFGMVYGLAEAPKVQPGTVVSVANVQGSRDLRPYWVLIRPTEILDWVTDQFDKFMYVKRQQFLDDLRAGKVVHLERYTEWYPDKIVISEIDVSDGEGREKLLPVEEIANRLGTIPLRVCRFRRSKVNRYLGESFLIDFAGNNREVMNLDSLRQEFLYRQCFSQLAMEADTAVPMADQQQGESGTGNVLLYPRGAKEPKFINPDTAPAEFITKAMQDLIGDMYRRAAQDTINELFNGGRSSGFSKSQSFKTTVARIATRGDALEHFESEMMVLTLQYLGQDWDGAIKYKDHYEVTNLTDALAQMTTMFKDLQIPSKTFAAAQMKRMIHEFDGKLSPDQIEKAYSEIDSTDWTEWFDTMKLAFIGRAAVSPDAGLALGQKVTPTAASGPVKGKDTATKPSTPQRAQGTSAEVKAESRS